MSRRFVSSFCCGALLLLPAPASAADKREELLKTEAALAAGKARQQDLAAQSKRAQEELDAMQSALADTAQKLQALESRLADSEEKLVILQSQFDEKHLALQTRRKDIGSMLTAALRLSQTPPEAAIMMPGDFIKTLKSVRAVDAIAQALKTETESLGRQLRELGVLKDKIEGAYTTVRKQRETLGLKQAALRHDMTARQALVKKLGDDQSQSTREIAALAQKAASLKELVGTIEKSWQKESSDAPEDLASTRTEKRRRRNSSESKMRAFTRAKGSLRLPVAGKITRRYGVALNSNDTTKGLTIRTPAKASVIAPFDGEVVYSGAFLNYGKLVILRHRDDFHTLISGLARADVVAGQFLLEGEPIGAMGERISADRLYFELRQNNQPIDPADWIASP